jgi:hypothetical protein
VGWAWRAISSSDTRSRRAASRVSARKSPISSGVERKLVLDARKVDLPGDVDTRAQSARVSMGRGIVNVYILDYRVQ